MDQLKSPDLRKQMKVTFLKQGELGLQEEHHPEEAGEAGVQQGSQDKQHQW